MRSAAHPFFLMEFMTVFAQYSHHVIAAHRHTFSLGVSWSAHAVLALIAGILILIRPKLLNFIVALYLILIGLIGLFNLPWS